MFSPYLSFEDHSLIIVKRHKLMFFSFIGAMKIASVANLTWLLITILIQFVLPSLIAYIAVVCFGVLFLVVPAVNYIRMLFAIRRHNRQLGDAVVSEQTMVILLREKKVALNMWIVAILLLASLTPALLMKVIELRYPRVHSIVLPWSLTMAFLASSINPLFYCGRNKHFRNALKAIINMRIFAALAV